MWEYQRREESWTKLCPWDYNAEGIIYSEGIILLVCRREQEDRATRSRAGLRTGRVDAGNSDSDALTKILSCAVISGEVSLT